MMPMWGAHQRSAPHHSWGMTSTRPRADANAMAMRICSRCCVRASKSEGLGHQDCGEIAK